MNDLKAITEEWLNQCGPHDFGVDTAGCRCPQGDPRPVISSLVAEVERLRAALAEFEPGPAFWVGDPKPDGRCEWSCQQCPPEESVGGWEDTSDLAFAAAVVHEREAHGV